jgi:inward rectifier potassium channel
MAILRRSRNLKSETNTGFGTNSSSTGGRFFNRDGNPNVIKKGLGILDRYSWYHTMLDMKRGKFILLLFSIYIFINLLFAGIYYIIGIDHLGGVQKGSTWRNFTEVFFFSAQTFTTVGYGRISPIGFWASAVSTFEAFLGLLSFALATGLFYGKFSRPRAYIKFSSHALISPYKDGRALMFRMVPIKNNDLTDVEVKATLAISTEENGRIVDKFYTLDLELSKITVLALSWTIVHPIIETSPLYGLSHEEMMNMDIEVMIFVRGYDTVFANSVIARTSYVSNEFIIGGKFKMMYGPNDDKSKTILDLDKLNDYDKVPLPDVITAPTT